MFMMSCLQFPQVVLLLYGDAVHRALASPASSILLACLGREVVCVALRAYKAH